MKFWKLYWITVGVVVLVLGVTIWWCFYSTHKSVEGSLQYAQAQLIFGVVAFIGIVFSLFYATAQFRRSLAKPILKLSLDQEGTTKLTMEWLTLTPLSIYIYNGGNKVTTTYQIEFVIPNVFDRYLMQNRQGLVTSEQTAEDVPDIPDAFKLNFYSANRPEFASYVDKYVLIGYLRPKLPRTVEPTSKKLTIGYKIFGDWGKHQPGSLELDLT